MEPAASPSNKTVNGVDNNILSCGRYCGYKKSPAVRGFIFACEKRYRIPLVRSSMQDAERMHCTGFLAGSYLCPLVYDNIIPAAVCMARLRPIQSGSMRFCELPSICKVSNDAVREAMWPYERVWTANP